MTDRAFDVVVLGAGAAGMMAAATAGARGRHVLLVDHYDQVGEKIRISGGGRCNFTNLHTTHRDFLSRNPDFCRSALARFTPRHFIERVERHGIAYHEKTLGQLFCDGRSRQIVDMLVADCAAAGVQWRQPCEVRSVERGPTGFRVATGAGDVDAASVVVATGGLTVPKIGASPFGYRLAEQRAGELGGTIVGFYHSHPNEPARPSAYDLDHAWPNLTYVIISVRAGVPGDITVWHLRDDRSGFNEGELKWPTGY